MPRRRGKRGGGGLTQRPNGRWQAQWSSTEGGRRVRKTATFRLRSEAQWWLREAQRGNAPDVDVSVEEYLERWLRGKRNIRPSTHALYASHVKVHLVPELGRFRVTELAPRHVERFVDGLSVAPGTASLILRTLKAALQSGVRRRELPDNPAATVKPPYIARKPVEAMTEDDAERILSAVEGEWIEHIVRFLMGSGCRVGEACALNQEDIGEGFVRIKRPKGAPRATLVTEDGMAALREAVAKAPRRGPKEPVFYGPATGDRVSRASVSHALARTLARHGLPRMTAHKLRHGVATLMLAAGWDFKTIADQLGNTPRVAQETYSHVAPARARAAIAALERRKNG